MKVYVGIYIKTEKAQELDGFGNKMKYHFHITTVHKYWIDITNIFINEPVYYFIFHLNTVIIIHINYKPCNKLKLLY